MSQAEDRISELGNKVKDLNEIRKECRFKEKTEKRKIQEMWDNMKRPKPSHCRYRWKRRISSQWHRLDLQQNHRKLLQAKERYTHIDTKKHTEYQIDESKKETGHIIIQTLSIQNKKCTLKAVRGKKIHSHIKETQQNNRWFLSVNYENQKNPEWCGMSFWTLQICVAFYWFLCLPLAVLANGQAEYS